MADYEILKKTDDEEYALGLIENKKYVILEENGDEWEPATTPGGIAITTLYKPLAERLLSDIEMYGIDCYSPESIIPWHFTMIDNFGKMEHQEVEDILAQSFLRRDWTLDSGIGSEKWFLYMGDPDDRRQEIKDWLSKCTHMQMTAACCIGNAHHSLNIAYAAAWVMEHFEGEELDEKLHKLATLIGQYSQFSEGEDIYNDFKTFELYYGIHLKENGPIIKQDLPKAPEELEYEGKEVSVETLIGRHFFHYTDGEKDAEQPLIIEISVLTLDTEAEDEKEDDSGEEDDDSEEEEDDEDDYGDDCLSDHLSADCWVKKIRSNCDEQQSYYYLEIVVKDGVIDNVYVTEEDVQQMGCGGMFFMPGIDMGSTSYFSELDYVPEECEAELANLVAGKCLKKGFSFIGKRLPQEMLDEGGNGGSDTEYTYACQSAFRSAYMHMSIDTTEEGIIKDFDYSTYQSSGSAWGDMFSRPQFLSDMEDEAFDMLLYIIDKYDVDEFKKL